MGARAAIRWRALEHNTFACVQVMCLPPSLSLSVLVRRSVYTKSRDNGGGKVHGMHGAEEIALLHTVKRFGGLKEKEET
eukprot:886122-Prymnesium_polylepis.1